MKRFVSDIRKTLGVFKNNIHGSRLKEKILVIESDDWGSIRMPSKKAYDALRSAGIRVDRCPFLTYDSFETEDDFDALYTVLLKFKGKDGKPPIVTANYIMGNPDFERIRRSGFREYSVKPFPVELDEKGIRKKYFDIYNQGRDQRLILAQLHGMEHVNVPYWMSFLASNSDESRFAFDQGVYGISSNVTSEKRRNFLAAFDYETVSEFDHYIKPSLVRAHQLFHGAFGFYPVTFIAPNYFWDWEVENVLASLKIKGIQSARNQRLPIAARKLNHKPLINHRVGETNGLGQHYLVRNVIFEPSSADNKEIHLADCLRQISIAFGLKKPAIICSHRLNFVGGFSEKNRSTGLHLLEALLHNVTKRWPDVVFMSSDQLSSVFSNLSRGG